MALLPRRRRSRGEAVAPARARRRALPPPGELRRDRRLLLRLREERLRDLGGLVLEMFRRDSFREGLLYEQCAELVSMEARLGELEALLGGGRARTTPCACGASLAAGSRFCPDCGRPAGERPVVACSACGRALAADASFCPVCATPVNDTSAEPLSVVPR